MGEDPLEPPRFLLAVFWKLINREKLCQLLMYLVSQINPSADKVLPCFLTAIPLVATAWRCGLSCFSFSVFFPRPQPALWPVTYPVHFCNSGICKDFMPSSSAPSVFLRVSICVAPYQKPSTFLEGLPLTEGLKSPIFKMIPYGSPSASQDRLLTNVLSSLQIHFWQEATRVPFIKALHIILYAHSYCRHFWTAINLCDRNCSFFLQVTSSNCLVLFSIALHLSWSYLVMQTPTRLEQ